MTGDMRILIINPQRAIANGDPPRFPCNGSALMEDGHELRLLKAEDGVTPSTELVQQAIGFKPRAILIVDCTSSSEHPIVAELTRLLRAELPDAWIAYSGAYPAHRWREVLLQEPQIDVILRSESGQTAARLMWALETGRSLYELRGIAFRNNGVPVSMPPAAAAESVIPS